MDFRDTTSESGAQDDLLSGAHDKMGQDSVKMPKSDVLDKPQPAEAEAATPEAAAMAEREEDDYEYDED